MGCYIDTQGNYYEGDKAALCDMEVQQRQNPADVWGNGEWTPNLRVNIINQIEFLESQVTQRRLREAVLGIDNGWLQSLNEQIAVLRSQLT